MKTASKWSDTVSSGRTAPRREGTPRLDCRPIQARAPLPSPGLSLDQGVTLQCSGESGLGGRSHLDCAPSTRPGQKHNAVPPVGKLSVCLAARAARPARQPTPGRGAVRPGDNHYFCRRPVDVCRESIRVTVMVLRAGPRAGSGYGP